MRCVINQEMLLAGRRQRLQFLRWGYAGLIVVQIVPHLFLADTINAWFAGNGFNDFFERLVMLHFGLIAILTPAVVGGAITDEKTSGTLQYLLTAHLSPWEIVLGKLLARTHHLALMSLAGLPLICLFCGFGGVFELPIALVALSLAMIFGVAAASILASVWCRQTRDALLTIYLAGVALLALRFIVPWPRLAIALDTLAPLRALALDQGWLVWPRVRDCLLAWSMLGLICLAVATLRLRGAYLRQLRAVPRATTRWLPAWRPRIRANPVLWRERHVVGIAPLPWLQRWPRWLGCIFVVALTLTSLAWTLDSRVPLPAPPPVAGVIVGDVETEPPMMGTLRLLMDRTWSAPAELLADNVRNRNVLYWYGLAALLAGTFVVAVRASGCITAERERDTWQPLLQTPLLTRTILRGKQWGILGAAVPHLVAYAAPVLTVSVFVGALATAWTVLWLIATVFAVLFVAAVGIWCSARMRNSWTSLLATLGMCYGIWIAVTGSVAVVTYFVKGLFDILLAFIDWLFGISPVVSAVQSFNPGWLTIGLGFVATFWLVTRQLLLAAERYIQKRDRAKEVDPQFHEFHKAWLWQIGQTAGLSKPPDAGLLAEPLPVAHESAEPPLAIEPPEPREDSDTLLPVPPGLLPDYNRP